MGIMSAPIASPYMAAPMVETFAPAPFMGAPMVETFGASPFMGAPVVETFGAAPYMGAPMVETFGSAFAPSLATAPLVGSISAGLPMTTMAAPTMTTMGA